MSYPALEDILRWRAVGRLETGQSQAEANSIQLSPAETVLYSQFSVLCVPSNCIQKKKPVVEIRTLIVDTARMEVHSFQEKIELREDLKSRRGLAVSLEIICHNCGESTSTMSSKISNKCYDVNLRLTYGMRAIGKGGAAARIFCGLMNLPPPPAKSKVYGDTEVKKLECVGHVQKRMGTRLRNILKMSKGIKLSDGKNISGRGRLTLKEVDSIQHYYGLAIRKNLSSVEDMKRAIWAIYFHKLSTEDNPQHALCPLGEDSWCGYNRSIVTGEFYIHKHSLPESILLKVKKSVSGSHREGLIEKCLHGRTQNPNESFNKCIWERIPKTVLLALKL
ncbi:uncharacterized protein TNCV_4827261 [Trichonephila clavipes]|nr:uncharacterized protein TNCV_4827261 [Trichonephila clavipes]